jgi:hypothetical protein
MERQMNGQTNNEYKCMDGHIDEWTDRWTGR